MGFFGLSTQNLLTHHTYISGEFLFGVTKAT